ncbi:MAG TPA: hypothetical protein VFE23_12410 [Usitatibacter sp.]|jgi:hypothetical protein|nr:hypothetical protein [Usitatibacter sp.]
MTQDIAKDTAPAAGTELDAAKVESVGGGTDVCNVADLTAQLTQAYENLIDTASYIMDRVASATKSF